MKLFDCGVKKSNDNPSTSQKNPHDDSRPADTDAAEPERKKSRNFVKTWEAKYPGIFERDGKLYCKPCTTCTAISDKTSSLVQGNASFRTTGLDKHWNSKPHERAAKRYDEVEGARTGTPIQGAMDTAIRKMNTANRAILIKLFNTVYYVLKSEDPFTSLPRLLDLQIKNGSDLTRLTSYKSDQACRRYLLEFNLLNE